MSKDVANTASGRAAKHVESVTADCCGTSDILIQAGQSFQAGWDARAELDHSEAFLEGAAEWEDEARLAKLEVKRLKLLLSEFLIWSRENADDYNYYYGELVEKTRLALKETTKETK